MNFNLPVLAENGYTFNPKNPLNEDETLDIEVTVRGVKSRKVRDFMVAKLKAERKAENAKKNKKDEDDNFDIEALDASMAEIAANRIIGWKNITVTNDKGKEVEFEYSEANALELMTKYDWLRTEVIEQSNAVANFTKS